MTWQDNDSTKPKDIFYYNTMYVTSLLIVGLLKIIRFYNLLIIALTQYMVRIFLIGPKENWKAILIETDVILIIISTTMIAAAGYIINDYYDVKIDAVNKPQRVVIDRSMKRRQAIIVHFCLNFTGIGLGLFIHWKLSVIYAAIATLLWLYSNSLKRKPLIGNLAIALLSASTIWILAAYYKSNEYIIFIFGLFALIISLIREIIKDMQDMKGDQSFGCRTLPIVWGIRRTKYIIYMISALFIGTVVLLLYPDYIKILKFQIMAVFPLVVLLALLLHKSDTTKKFRLLSHLCKLILVTGVISMVIF